MQFLRNKGVTQSFGYPGGAVIPLYDQMMIEKFPHILARHEQGAIHEAEGYARVSGKPGVVIATSGPGATNLVTGLANAYLDSTPVFAVTGQVASGLIGRDSFQEADVVGITMPVTKFNFLVKAPSDLPYALEQAWQTMLEGRMGPVAVDITKDVFLSEIPEIIPEATRKTAAYDDAGAAAKAVFSYLSKSQRPLLLLGGGVAVSEKAASFANQLCRALSLPAVNTLMGKGAANEYKSYSLGLAGMHGLPAANLAMKNCDLLLAVGARFSDRLLGKPGLFETGRVICHIDIDLCEHNKNVNADFCAHLPAEVFLQEAANLAACFGEKNKWQAWARQTQEWKAQYAFSPSQTDEILPEEVVRLAAKHAPENGILATDVGQNQMFAAQHYPLSAPGRFLTSGGLGTMGFGLPAAIGGAVASGGAPVSLFVGDGGLQMTVQELATLNRLGANVKVFLLDNACLGMVRQWQQLFNGERYSHTILNDNPDFFALAKAYGLKTLAAHGKNTLEDVIKKAYETDGPVFVHCKVAQAENVMPMIPPGQNPEDMMGHNDFCAGC